MQELSYHLETCWSFVLPSDDASSMRQNDSISDYFGQNQSHCSIRNSTSLRSDQSWWTPSTSMSSTRNGAPPFKLSTVSVWHPFNGRLHWPLISVRRYVYASIHRAQLLPTIRACIVNHILCHPLAHEDMPGILKVWIYQLPRLFLRNFEDGGDLWTRTTEGAHSSCTCTVLKLFDRPSNSG